jgi:hypothetical protein
LATRKNRDIFFAPENVDFPGEKRNPESGQTLKDKEDLWLGFVPARCWGTGQQFPQVRALRIDSGLFDGPEDASEVDIKVAGGNPPQFNEFVDHFFGHSQNQFVIVMHGGCSLFFLLGDCKAGRTRKKPLPGGRRPTHNA